MVHTDLLHSGKRSGLERLEARVSYWCKENLTPQHKTSNKGKPSLFYLQLFPPCVFFSAPFLLWSCHETLDHIYTNWIAINTCDRIRGNWDIQKNCTIHGINALCTLYAWKHTDIFHTAEELLWLNKLNMVEVSLLTVFTNTENIPFVK